MSTPRQLEATTRSQAHALLESLGARLRHGVLPDPEEVFFLHQIRRAVEDRFLAGIRERQARIPGLQRGAHGYLGVWGGELTPGCASCLDEGFDAIRSVSTCNLDCHFCYYQGREHELEPLLPDEFALRGRVVTAADLEAMITKVMQGPRPLRALAWVWLEPFVELDKHLPLIRTLHEHGVHQHLYTNGTLCTPDGLRRLGEAGLDELRFNLAATRCADQVIEAMRAAREHVRYLCIESPMFPEYLEAFVARRQEILATGVDHIHCAELQVTAGTLERYSLEELYQYREGYVSPVWSRPLTYDLLDLAVAEGWTDVTIHDCSNEVKLLRGLSPTDLGEIDYEAELELPLPWYALAIDRLALAGG